jgi:TetR/AcrR family transcriptional repressor of nem operon
MRVSRAQAEENRQTVIDVASRLFRKHGFDGVGLKDLMEAAGLTQGAFYKQFSSKEDLAAQASKRALESATERWSAAAAADPEDPIGSVVKFYLSMAHCAQKMDGCPIVALGSDAARQGREVKASFEAGIRSHLEMFCSLLGDIGDEEATGKAMAIASTMVGAVLLARAVNDKELSRQFLQSAADSILAGLSARDSQHGSLQ